MKRTIFPYRTLRGDVDVSITDVKVDGTLLATDSVSPNERTVILHGLESRHWERITFRVDVQAPPAALREFESEFGALALSVVVACRSSNLRQPIRLDRSTLDPSLWGGSAELQRSDFRDKARVYATLTASVGGALHRPVASSDVWTFHFDPSDSFRIAGSLRVLWVDFKDELAPPIARQFPDSAYVVDLDQPLPEILLNKSFEGLDPIIRDSKDRSPTEQALHDITRMSIARSAWLALLHDAMAAVRPTEDTEEPSWPEREWHTEVLQRILPEIDPGKSESELLRLAANDWRAHPGSAAFVSRAEAVIGDLIGANKALRKSTQALIRRGIVT